MSNQHVYEHFLSRFLTLYGEPKTDDVDRFLAEYASALARFESRHLLAGASKLVSEHKFRSWPTIAECIDAVEVFAPSNRPEPMPTYVVEQQTPQQKSNVQRLVAEFRKSIANRNREVITAREQKQPEPLSEEAKRAEFHRFITDGEARMYARDRTIIRSKMAGEI